MSLLDNEYNLIEDIKKSCDFLSILDDVLKKYLNDCSNSNTTGIFDGTAKIDCTLHERLPSIGNYKWYYTAYNAITLRDRCGRDTVCNIGFYQKYDNISKAFIYEYRIELIDGYHKDNVLDTIKDMFRLEDKFLWKSTTFRGYGYTYTQYSQIYTQNYVLVQ